MIDISYLSLASILALIIFLAVIVPRSLYHVGRAALGLFSSRKQPVDGWLVAIALSILVCAGLSAATGLYNNRAHTLLDESASVTLSFLFFATPGVLQVLRAWRNKRAEKTKVTSHLLVALAVLSLPASMAVPTAALLQSTAALTAQPGAVPADSLAAGIADERYFTDNEVANDPEDYPVAAFLQQNFSLHRVVAPGEKLHARFFYREIPMFTAFWLDQTANALTFEATDTFGLLISRITHVRANLAFSSAVFLYKLLCALVLVAVSFDAVLSPVAEYAVRLSRIRSAKAATLAEETA